ncbi:zincin-like metallopeptidase domain-containing protein [Dyadobacter sp. LHD-138]|uniref:ArdC family protein n=1 Tax=Dyadobacter sp. LHD-138 TaxID=3071413 RepID=UPI0027DEBD31|nr:zincin-like metallopeptidase domain-containing protein [Dyadobacter sp. LHD-138]MDQ6482170.1 zincin-like metallopeptidase domain-containing protein [Dyadobacter sp. LHD-138]
MNSHQSKDSNQSIATPDIYTRVTDKIMSDLERGELTWRKPWNSQNLSAHVTFPMRWNNIPYTGINTILLWATAAEKSYDLPHWMTFNQALELKGSVIKGEKGTQIVYADRMVKEEEDKNGDTQLKQIPYLKTYTVFNVSQINGLPDQYYKAPEVKQTELKQRIAELESFFANTKADIYTGTEASYNQNADRIQMPPIEIFDSVEDYYSVLAHELTHWTKHPKRLDRDFGRKKYGDEGYAKEELVAEIGSCYLSALLGIEPMPEEKHAAYLQSWLKAINNDKRLIFAAASYAQKAVEYVQGLQPSS